MLAAVAINRIVVPSIVKACPVAASLRTGLKCAAPKPSVAAMGIWALLIVQFLSAIKLQCNPGGIDRKAFACLGLGEVRRPENHRPTPADYQFLQIPWQEPL